MKACYAVLVFLIGIMPCLSSLPAYAGSRSREYTGVSSPQQPNNPNQQGQPPASNPVPTTYTATIVENQPLNPAQPNPVPAPQPAQQASADFFLE